MSEIIITHTRVFQNMTGNKVEIVLVSEGMSKGIDPQTDPDDARKLLELGEGLFTSPEDLSGKAHVAFTDDGSEREDLEDLSERVAQDKRFYPDASGIALARGGQTIPEGVPLHQGAQSVGF